MSLYSRKKVSTYSKSGLEFSGIANVIMMCKARINKFIVSQAIDYQKSMHACANKTTNWSNW